MSEPTPKQTEDKMNWKPEDIEWIKTPPARPKKTAAQRLADRIKRGDGSNQQRG